MIYNITGATSVSIAISGARVGSFKVVFSGLTTDYACLGC